MNEVAAPPAAPAAYPLASPNARPKATAPKPEVFAEHDRILIATPCYGGQAHYEHLNSVFHAMASMSGYFIQDDGSVRQDSLIADRIYLQNESHIDRARNKLANVFLRKRWNWLLFWDADVVAPWQAVAILWGHGQRGARLVAAPYASKGVVPQFVVNVAPGAQKREDGLVEVVNAGTGFMLIHRSVFETLEREGRAEEYQLGSNDPDVLTHKTARAYFKSGVRLVKLPDGRTVKLWLSEDYMFCYEFQKCGGKVFMDPRPQLDHIGTAKYPLNPDELVAAYRELQRINHPAVTVAAAAKDT